EVYPRAKMRCAPQYSRNRSDFPHYRYRAVSAHATAALAPSSPSPRHEREGWIHVSVRSLAASLATLLLGAATVLGLAQPASAAGHHYVALGDSYSSGVGAGSYTSESGACKRSTKAYPQLWANANSPSSF